MKCGFHLSREQPCFRLMFESLESRTLLSVSSVDLDLSGASSEISILGSVGEDVLVSTLNIRPAESGETVWNIDPLGNVTAVRSFENLALTDVKAFSYVNGGATEIDGKLAVLAMEEHAYGLWITSQDGDDFSLLATSTVDGRALGLSTILSVSGRIVGFNDEFVWSTNGVDRPVVISESSSFRTAMKVFDDVAFFTIGESSAPEVWITDGTEDGTRFVTTLSTRSVYTNELGIVKFDGRYHSPPAGNSLAWTYDPDSQQLTQLDYMARNVAADGHDKQAKDR